MQEIAELPDKDEILYVDLKGRDPDEGFTRVLMSKECSSCAGMEEVFGRDGSTRSFGHISTSSRSRAS